MTTPAPAMKAFEVSIRLRNNRLKQRREELGLNASQLCERIGIGKSDYAALETMRAKPTKADGSWRIIAVRLSEFYFVEPDELFPPVVRAVEKPVAIRRMDGEDIAELCMGKVAPMLPETVEQVEAVADALHVLRPREREVLERRFGIGRVEESLEEIGVAFGVGRERVRQMESNALRRLRNPRVSKLLKEHWEP